MRLTSRYRHDAPACVHPVAPALPRPTLPAIIVQPAGGSSPPAPSPRLRPLALRAATSSASPSASRDFGPGFADSVAADYSSSAVDLASVDPGFVAGRFVIAVAAAADPVAGLSFDPSCFAGFSATVAVVASGAPSVSRSSS